MRKSRWFALVPVCVLLPQGCGQGDSTSPDAAPNIQVTPGHLAFAMSTGQTATETLLVENSGNATLTVGSITDDREWLTEAPTSFSVHGGTSQTVAVTASAESLSVGMHTGTITIASNDSDDAARSVGVTLSVGFWDLAGLLPSDGEIPGWYWNGLPSEARDGASLYDLIDGGAEDFVERGFVSGILHHYRGALTGTVATLELLIADLGSPSNARSIFDRRADRLPFAQDISVGHAAQARIDEVTGLDTVVLDFWQDRFYVQAALDNRQTAPNLARQTAIQFAENVSQAIFME